MSDSDRRYSDDQAREIIKRALQMQHRQADEEGPREGITIADLESIADEVGVSRELMRRAASEVDSGEADIGKSRFIGAAISPRETFSLPHQVTQDDLGELVVALPSIAGEDGSGNAHRSSLSWSTNSVAAMRTGRSLQVSIRGTSSGTVVRVREELSQVAGGLFGGLIGGVGLGGGFGVGFGVGLGSLGSPLFAVAVPILFITGSYFLARSIFKAVSKSRRRNVQRVAARIREFLQGPSAMAPEVD
jgi:hypothetical protein